MEKDIYFKKCICCGKFKDGSLFGLSKENIDEIKSECKECINYKQRLKSRGLPIPPNEFKFPPTDYNINVFHWDKNHVKEKCCKKCGETKTREDFRIDNAMYDGLDNMCKQCQKARAANKIHKIVEYKVCTQCDKDKEIEAYGIDKNADDGHHSYCKQCANDKAKAIRLDRAKKRKLAEEEKTEFKLPDGAICAKLHNFIWATAKRVGLPTTIKNSEILKAAGYTLKELKEHLESQFEDWMNWENYGPADLNYKRFHIDHIIPASKLQHTTLQDPNFKTCWALSNLRPLEAIENIKKSNKILPHHTTTA